jgi:hypothetical protein
MQYSQSLYSEYCVAKYLIKILTTFSSVSQDLLTHMIQCTFIKVKFFQYKDIRNIIRHCSVLWIV